MPVTKVSKGGRIWAAISFYSLEVLAFGARSARRCALELLLGWPSRRPGASLLSLSPHEHRRPVRTEQEALTRPHEIERGKHGQPEIKGYTQEYLDASSPRRGQIMGHLQEIGREGAGAAQDSAAT